ncbi:MAG TPA: sugar ABC transporter substrate-binding protein [Solirubrobacterales bacterium]|nr:sugar ABC transporter substrate-binding protein [Solirubrobacterales bacterium]
MRISQKPHLWLVALGAIVLAVGLAACGGGSSSSSASNEAGSSNEGGGEEATTASSTETGTEGEGISGKSVWVVGCADAIPYCAGQNKTFEAVLGEAGADVTVVTSPYEATKQAQQMDQAIAQNAEAIVLQALTVTPIIPQLEKAKAAGIPVFLIDAPPPPELPEGLYAAHIGGESVEQGEAAATALIKGMEEAGSTSGNVIVVGGASADTTTPARVEGFEKVLSGTSFKVVAEEDAEWDPVKAATIATQLLAKYGNKDGGVQGIYGMSGDMAASIAKAAQQSGYEVGAEKGGMVVVGSNCSPRSIAEIKDGLVYADLQQSPVYVSEKASEVIIEALEGKEIEDEYVLPTPTIEKSNVQKYAKACTF